MQILQHYEQGRGRSRNNAGSAPFPPGRCRSGGGGRLPSSTARAGLCMGLCLESFLPLIRSFPAAAAWSPTHREQKAGAAGAARRLRMGQRPALPGRGDSDGGGTGDTPPRLRRARSRPSAVTPWPSRAWARRGRCAVQHQREGRGAGERVGVVLAPASARGRRCRSRADTGA